MAKEIMTPKTKMYGQYSVKITVAKSTTVLTITPPRVLSVLVADGIVIVLNKLHESVAHLKIYFLLIDVKKSIHKIRKITKKGTAKRKKIACPISI